MLYFNLCLSILAVEQLVGATHCLDVVLCNWLFIQRIFNFLFLFFTDV